jgi:DNA-binding NtrC family response regulator
MDVAYYGGARRPWNVPLVKAQPISTGDTPEQMDICFNCPIPPEACKGNCNGAPKEWTPPKPRKVEQAKPDKAKKEYPSRRFKYDKQLFCSLYNKQMNDKEIADILGTTKTTICRIRKRYGFRSNADVGGNRIKNRPIVPEKLI